MTREEEIKSRATRYGVKYVELDGSLANLAEGDMAYLLDRNEELSGELAWHKRELEEKVDEIYWLADDKIDLRNENEELQRRVVRLEKVAERSRAMVDLFIEKVESGAARSKKTYEDALAVREELLGLDAKEQDDDY